MGLDGHRVSFLCFSRCLIHMLESGVVCGSFGQTGVGCPPQLRWKGLVCVHSSGRFPSGNGAKDPIGSPTTIPSVPGHTNPDPTWDEKRSGKGNPTGRGPDASFGKRSVWRPPPCHVTPGSAPASPALSTVQLVPDTHVPEPGRPVLRATDAFAPSPSHVCAHRSRRSVECRRGSKETSGRFSIAISSKDLHGVVRVRWKRRPKQFARNSRVVNAC